MMNLKLTARVALALGTASVFALAAGCTTAGASARYDTYGAPRYASNYTGPDRLYRNNYVRYTRPETSELYAAQAPTDPRIFASFEGIAGARLAHEIYPEQQAERLDGACEPYIRAASGENLYDIAQLCDVSISMLEGVNPQIRNARHVRNGDLIQVPQVYNAERAAFMQSYATNNIVAASAYVVQPGDTLTDIAAKHLASAASVAQLNPNVNWDYLPVGATVMIPAKATAQGMALPVQQPQPQLGSTSLSLPYNHGHAGSGGGSGYDVTGIMPYQLTPAQKAAEKNAPRGLLTISARTVNPGEQVYVSGRDLPKNADVNIYSGTNGRDLKLVRTVRTDSNGEFEEPFGVSDVAGGVIFQATVDGSDERLQSPRVGVVDKD
jgi:LysM repeat protein